MIIIHFGKQPSKKARLEAAELVNIVDWLVFSGDLETHIRKIEIYHSKDFPPGFKRECWLTDGLRGMYDPKSKTVRTCLRNFYGTWLWGMAHDLCHVNDLTNGNLRIVSADEIEWLGQTYTSKYRWVPGTSRSSKTAYKSFDGIFKPVILAADQYVPWEVKPSVMAEVALMELRAKNRKNRVS